MYELSVALKYLIPRRRQLSVSIIALLSVLVISLVVWLVCVFMSVTHGIERRWIETLTALNAPVTLTPTDAYYDSYYYQVDGYSSAADFTHKTIGEKREQGGVFYDEELDPMLPMGFPHPDTYANGRLKDPVGGAFAAVEAIPGVGAGEFETALASLRLRMVRAKESSPFGPQSLSQSFLNQVSYLGSFDGNNPRLAQTLVRPKKEDLSQVLQVLSLSGDNIREESPGDDRLLPHAQVQERLTAFFQNAHIKSLETRPEGWAIPPQIHPKEGEIPAFAVMHNGVVDHVRLFGEEGVPGRIKFEGEKWTFTNQEGLELPRHPLAALLMPSGVEIPAQLDEASLQHASDAADLRFEVQLAVNGVEFAGKIPYTHLSIGEAEIAEQFDVLPDASPPWLHSLGERERILPHDEEAGYGMLLARSYQENDVRIGDRGYLAYYSLGPSSLQEQRIPVYVAGFYDPGLTPGGGRLVLVSSEVTADVRAAINQADAKAANGIHVWFDDVYQADAVKEQIVANLQEQGIDQYWTVETYKDYEFAKPLLQQFQSDRVLFSAIALIIIVVACSNIISMLILLVNDKRREIGVLRAMGATKLSVTAIFATCGTFMGLLGSAVGILCALLTLQNLGSIIGLLSAVQGHDAFNDAFYGGALPNEMSGTVLTMVIGATIVVSIIAGIIPAIKAARIRPSQILRAE